MIPVNTPFLGKEELANVSDCLKSGWISSRGSYIKSFEEGFAKFCGVSYGISTTSGTTALHLALATLGIGKGDEVIMPTFTMIATAYAVLYTGARPIFIDSEARTWNMDSCRIKKALTPRTKAIIPVHIYGHPVDMDPVISLAKKHKLFIIEDAAQAHGAEYKGKKCGSLGDIACFSFYANKIITTGEGGMVVTNNKRLAQRAQLLKDLAHSSKKRFLHTHLGFNYRMTNMQAGVGLAQLKKIDYFLKKKQQMAKLYAENLGDIKGLRFPHEENWAKNVYWMYAVLVEDSFGIERDAFMAELAKRGIETRAFFVPMHQQPVIKRIAPPNKKDRFPIAEDISKKGLYLPSGLALGEDDLLYVCKTIRKISRIYAK
jgi:perosamine synthetase